MYFADTPPWFPVLMVIVYVLYSLYNASKKKKKQQEMQRQMQEPGSSDSPDPSLPKPKSVEEVLTEMFREVESKTKPFARNEPPVVKKKPAYIRPQSVRAPISPVQKKKVTKPFLSADYYEESAPPERSMKEEFDLETSEESAPPERFLKEEFALEAIEPEGTSLNLEDVTGDVFRSSEIQDYDFTHKVAKKKQSAVTLRQALIGQIILQRPQW